jgi:isochorismate hydrolase
MVSTIFRHYRGDIKGTMPPNYLKEINQYNVRQAQPKPGRCALLVIDMQQYFLSMAEPILGNVLSVVEACRFKDISIIFTRHGHKDASGDGGMLAQWWGDLIEYGSKDWELINSLKPYDTDGIIDKNRYSVFHGTGLDEARDAFVKDYRVFFVSDATATVNDELHIASLKNLAFGFAHIVSTEQLRRYLTSQEKQNLHS